MVTRSNRGFSTIEILVVLAVVVAIGYAGWYAYQREQRHSSQPASQAQNNQSSVNASSMKGVALGLDTAVSNESKSISQIGKTPAIINAFYQWQDNSNNYVTFPTSWVDSIVKLGAMPMITWEPSAGTNSVGSSKDQPNFNLATVLSGKYDTYIKGWAQVAKRVNHTVYVRPMHEMNEPGYAWGAAVNGNTPAQYVSAFQHIVTIFQQNNATNVQFIWCVGANKLSPNPSVYFPGDKYISWISIDGYNRDKPWTSFMDIFTVPYGDITAISNRPVLIAETASVEDPNNPNNQADWINAAFLQAIPSSFPRIKAINYFSPGKGTTYSFDASQSTLNAIKQVFANYYYQAAAPSQTLSY
jgi:beta-mannanase